MSDPNTQPEPTMEEILASIRQIISEEEEGDAPEAPDAEETGSAVEDGDLAATLEEEAPELADEDTNADDDFEVALEAEMDPEDSREPELEEVPAEEPELEPKPGVEEADKPVELEGLADESDDFDEGDFDEGDFDEGDFDETVLELTEFVDIDDLEDEQTMLDPELTEDAASDDEPATPDPEPAAESEAIVASQPANTAERVEEPLSKLDFRALVSEEAAAQTSTAFVGFAEQLQQSRGVALGSSALTLEELVKDLLRPMLKEWLDENLPPLAQRLVEREIAKLAGHADDK